MKYTSIFLSAVIVVFMLMFAVLPKSDFSENENRNLQKPPKFTIDNVIDGKFTEDIADYLTDHFPFRDNFIAIKTGFEKNVLHKKLVNNIYICKDNYLIENYNKPQNTQNIINTLNNFSKSLNVKPYIMLVPTAFEVYGDKLPQFAYNNGQLEDIRKMYSQIDMTNIQVYDYIKQSQSPQLYYRLDHHWTTDGAYCGYKAFCAALGIKPYDFDINTVATGFKGTIYSKLNDDNIPPDDIKACVIDDDLTVVYDDKKSDSIYNDEYLDKKDKYSYFLDNLHSFIEITNNSLDNGKSIAIIKDSYANCFVPFLTKHYNKIYVFDPRSYKSSISQFVNENNVDDVLVLYNMNTIDNDAGIKAIY